MQNDFPFQPLQKNIKWKFISFYSYIINSFSYDNPKLLCINWKNINVWFSLQPQRLVLSYELLNFRFIENLFCNNNNSYSPPIGINHISYYRWNPSANTFHKHDLIWIEMNIIHHIIMVLKKKCLTLLSCI